MFVPLVGCFFHASNYHAFNRQASPKAHACAGAKANKIKTRLSTRLERSVACSGFLSSVKKIEWRSPVRWSVFGPYITLYLATVMFYWWPLALIEKTWWYIYTVMFIISTFLNITSHYDSARRD
jgi:hypothetical protein